MFSVPSCDVPRAPSTMRSNLTPSLITLTDHWYKRTFLSTGATARPTPAGVQYWFKLSTTLIRTDSGMGNDGRQILYERVNLQLRIDSGDIFSVFDCLDNPTTCRATAVCRQGLWQRHHRLRVRSNRTHGFRIGMQKNMVPTLSKLTHGSIAPAVCVQWCWLLRWWQSTALLAYKWHALAYRNGTISSVFTIPVYSFQKFC